MSISVIKRAKSHVGLRLSFLECEVKNKSLHISTHNNISNYAQVLCVCDKFFDVQTSDRGVEILHTYPYYQNKDQAGKKSIL